MCYKQIDANVTVEIIFLTIQRTIEFKLSWHYLVPVATHGHDPSRIMEKSIQYSCEPTTLRSP